MISQNGRTRQLFVPKDWESRVRRWVETSMPSADTVGRVGNLIRVEALRSLLHDLYSRLKRMKALAPAVNASARVNASALSVHAQKPLCESDRPVRRP